MDFLTIAVDEEFGTTVNINTPGTTPEITVSEDVENGVDIKILGYTYQAAENGEQVDLTIEPLVSHNIYQTGTYTEQIPTDFENGVSMSGTLTENLIPTRLLELDGTGTNLPGYAVAFNYVYVLGLDNYIYRVSTIDGSIDTIEIYPNASRFDDTIVLGDINTVYLIYNANADDEVRLQRVDFCSSSITTIYLRNTTISEDGTDWYQDDVPFICKVEYDNKEYIVATVSYEPDDYENYGDRFEVWIYNISDDEFTNLGLQKLEDNYLLENTFSQFTSPKVHEGKVIFTASPFRFKVDPDPVQPSICMFPTYIVDCADKSIERINDYLVDTADGWPTSIGHSGVDRTNNLYYFNLEDFPPASYDDALLKIDLDAKTTSLVATPENHYYIRQGKDTCYAVEDLGDDKLVRPIPGLGVTGTLHDPYDRYGVVDEQNGLIWTYDDTLSPRVYGAGIIYRTPVSLSISGWGATPFKYGSSKRVSFFIIGGTAFLSVRSLQSSPRLYQQDIYILRPNIACS